MPSGSSNMNETTSSTPIASIIIATHNRKADLCELLDSLRDENVEARGVEVIIVDDASTDGTADAMRAGYPWVQLFAQTENAGPSASRNAGARAAKGDTLLFLDSDGVVEKGWLAAMLTRADPETPSFS